MNIEEARKIFLECDERTEYIDFEQDHSMPFHEDDSQVVLDEDVSIQV